MDVVLVPTIASCIWGAVFGNLGINLGEKGLMAIEKLQEAVATPEDWTFRSAWTISAWVYFITGSIGILVCILCNICKFRSLCTVCAVQRTVQSILQMAERILWGVIQSVMAIGLLMAGGLKPLQTISLVAAFLFIFVMFGTIAAFMKVLKEEKA